MALVYVLLPLALLVMAVWIALFVWAVRQGQFDDLETPALRILFDDDASRSKMSRPTSVSDAATVRETSET